MTISTLTLGAWKHFQRPYSVQPIPLSICIIAKTYLEPGPGSAQLWLKDTQVLSWVFPNLLPVSISEHSGPPSSPSGSLSWGRALHWYCRCSRHGCVLGRMQNLWFTILFSWNSCMKRH